MKVDAALIASLTAAMRARNVRELEIEEGEMSLRLALPRPALPCAVAAVPPKLPQDSGLIIVRSAAVGRFLRRHPSRTTDFVAGDSAAAGRMVGLVAAGSLLRPVVSPAEGVIVRWLCEAGDFVEFGTPLFELRPLFQPTR